MNPLNASWFVLKGGFKTIDLIAQECDTMAECLESMEQSFPDMDRETAIKLVTEARNNHARENMQSGKGEYRVAEGVEKPRGIKDTVRGMKNYLTTQLKKPWESARRLHSRSKLQEAMQQARPKLAEDFYNKYGHYPSEQPPMLRPGTTDARQQARLEHCFGRRRSYGKARDAGKRNR